MKSGTVHDDTVIRTIWVVSWFALCYYIHLDVIQCVALLFIFIFYQYTNIFNDSPKETRFKVIIRKTSKVTLESVFVTVRVDCQCVLLLIATFKMPYELHARNKTKWIFLLKTIVIDKRCFYCRRFFLLSFQTINQFERSAKQIKYLNIRCFLFLSTNAPLLFIDSNNFVLIHKASGYLFLYHICSRWF